MATSKGLGRGFDTLFPDTIVIQDVINRAEDKIHRLAVDAIKPRADQPRKRFDPQELEQLTYSIKQHGVVQPILVIEVEQNMYSIVAGERRWRAAQAAGLNEIPAIVRTLEDLQLLEMALLENIQRSDLTPLEVAESIQRLHQQFGQSYEQIALSLGKAYVTIINTQRLLKLPVTMRQALQDKQITEGHARSLLSLAKQPQEQQQLFEIILQRHLSVRQTEALAAKFKISNVVKTNDKPVHSTDSRAELLEKIIGAKVVHKPSLRGGTLTIRYKDTAKLDEIMSKFGL